MAKGHKTNAFGLPVMRKDIKDHATHASTGTPAYLSAAAIPNVEAQNMQQEALQSYERQQQA